MNDSGARIVGHLMGVAASLGLAYGLSSAGGHVGDGIRQGSQTLGEAAKATGQNVSNAMRESAETARRGMNEASAQIATAGLQAADLASKRVSLAMLESVARLTTDLNRGVTNAVSLFNQGTLQSVQAFTAELDRISRDRTAEGTESLDRALNQLQNQSREWQIVTRNASQYLGDSIVKGLTIHAIVIAVAVLVSHVTFAYLISERAEQKLALVVSPFFTLLSASPEWIARMLLAIIGGLTLALGVNHAGRVYATKKMDHALQWALINASLERTNTELDFCKRRIG